MSIITEQSRGGDARLPSVEQVLSGLTVEAASLTAKGTESLSLEEQKDIFQSLQSALKKTEEDAEGSLVREVHATFDQADVAATRWSQDLAALDNVPEILHKLWQCNSEYVAQATEALATGSRNRELDQSHY